MIDSIRVLTVILVAVAMGLALAHALELPGKMRLTRAEYLTVQPIYYPGFTIVGIAEPLGLIATLTLLILTPPGSRDFWLTLIALLGLIGMQAVYWTVTHPVNAVWLRDQALAGLGADFFAADPAQRSGSQPETLPDWTAQRNRWEYSHVARAVLGLVSLVALVIAVA